MFRVCSEYVQGMESDSLSHVFEILSNLGHIIRLYQGYFKGISGYIKGITSVCQRVYQGSMLESQ